MNKSARLANRSIDATQLVRLMLTPLKRASFQSPIILSYALSHALIFMKDHLHFTSCNDAGEIGEYHVVVTSFDEVQLISCLRFVMSKKRENGGSTKKNVFLS
jgi:hypothetical protein